MRSKHGFPPLFDKESTTLILGSFPSVASRKQEFFYGHPQNRFWKVLSLCFNEDAPTTIEEKTSFCKKHHIALYDSIESCEIKGSSDSSITDVVPADLSEIYDMSPIKLIVFNGNASEKWFKKYQSIPNGIEEIKMPSTSPANAAFSLERLVQEWKKAF